MGQSTLLKENKNGDWSFNGDVSIADAAVKGEGLHLLHVVREDGFHHVETVDNPGDPVFSGHDWGVGKTKDEALGFLLGAMFGPVDEEYDEVHLVQYVESLKTKTD